MSSKLTVIKAAQTVQALAPAAVNGTAAPARTAPNPGAAARAEALEARALALLAEAEELVAQRVNQAAADAEVIRQRAWAEGRAEGYAAGLAAAKAEAETILAAARAESESIRAAAERQAEQLRVAAEQEAAEQAARARAEAENRLAQLEPELVALSIDIARQVLKTELKLHPEAVATMAAAAVSRLRGKDRPRLRLHPQDAGLLEGLRGDWLAGLQAAGEIELVPDTSLAAGEFILHSTQGTVDGRLDSQLHEVAAALGLNPGAVMTGRS